MIAAKNMSAKSSRGMNPEGFHYEVEILNIRTRRFCRVLTMVYNTELLGFRTLSIVRILIN
jgi:hypothetical protein